MNEHVVDDLADFLEGRLTPAEIERIQNHLKQCTECAASIEWAESLRLDVILQGHRHLSPGRIVELASDVSGATLTAEENRHLALCSDCGDELDFEKGLPDPLEVAAPPVAAPVLAQGPSKASWWSRFNIPLWLPAAAVSVAVLVVLLSNARDSVQVPGRIARAPDSSSAPRDLPSPPAVPPAAAIANLARVESLPVHIFRDPVISDPFEKAFRRGLIAYRDRNLAAAQGFFREAVKIRPEDPVALLYLGSTLLLLDRLPEAVETLRLAIERANDPSILEESRWQLANAYLKLEDGPSALAALLQLQELSGDKAAPARSLVDSLALLGIRE